MESLKVSFCASFSVYSPNSHQQQRPFAHIYFNCEMLAMRFIIIKKSCGPHVHPHTHTHTHQTWAHLPLANVNSKALQRQALLTADILCTCVNSSALSALSFCEGTFSHWLTLWPPYNLLSRTLPDCCLCRPHKSWNGAINSSKVTVTVVGRTCLLLLLFLLLLQL